LHQSRYQRIAARFADFPHCEVVINVESKDCPRFGTTLQSTSATSH
jgi:hypothetical protein